MALRNLTSINWAGLVRSAFSWNAVPVRALSTSAVRSVKEIVHTEEEGKLIIEGKYLPSDRVDRLVRIADTEDPDACYLTRLNLDLKHTDVLILSQFVRSDGCMLPRRITGLSKQQQKRVGTMVTMAQKAGLMSSLTPAYSKKNPRLRYRWKKWNTYWDESTIKC